MGGFAMEFSQNQQLTQQMHLTPQMLQSVNFLMMNHLELTSNLYEAVQNNPALEILRDVQLDIGIVRQQKKKRNLEDAPLYKKNPPDAATNFQQFLESQADNTQGIQQHLWEQFKLTTTNATKLALAERLISTLDFRGFTQVAPISLLDENNPLETPALLKQVLAEIQNLDPVGCCTSGSEESLYVQALSYCETEGKNGENKLGKNTCAIALFLLAGNLSLLQGLRTPVIVEKLQFQQKQQELQKTSPSNQEIPDSTNSWTCKPDFHQLPSKITTDTVESSISFIKSLDPLPARQFSAVQGSYIYPEITVEQYEDDGEIGLKVILHRGILPEIILSPSFCKLDDKKEELPKDTRKFIKTSVKSAQDLLQALDFRENTLKNAAQALVELQRDFFLMGPQALRPLKMKDIAEKIQVHQSTISRIANGKYLRCQWGIFEIKYFFSNQVESSTEAHSKESIKFLLKEILKEHATDEKPLSDQKLTDILSQRGITIARRTVAKYRKELNIDSSFDRK